jgi:hypothetical protein
MLAMGAISCWADIDPLHGYCAGALQCIDNGTNTPTTINPPTGFGFTVSPGPKSGTLLIDLLIPNNADPSPASLSFGLTGTLAGTATLFSPTAWTSGFLASYLGIIAAPANPIGAYLGSCAAATPCTLNVDPGATGFFVYQASFANVTLQGPSNPNFSPLENFATGAPPIPIGSFITGFLHEGTGARDWVANANSGAIFEDAQPPGVTRGGTVPEPSSIVLFGSVVSILAIFLKRRRHSRA